MTASRDGAFGILIGAALGACFLVPAQSSAQDSISVSCANLFSQSPLEHLTRCAEQGHALAQTLLGLKYARGAGVQEDDAEAARWYRLAAKQGYAEAQWLLGIAYGNGDGVPEDDVLAYMWFNLAGAQGHVSAQESEDIIESRMAPAQIIEAQRLSREWIETLPTPLDDERGSLSRPTNRLFERKIGIEYGPRRPTGSA
jgi:hypothetical protein